MSTFQQSRQYPVSPATVFAAIRQPELLARWWGPTGFKNTFEVFEFRPLGRWLFTMHGPDGVHYPNESRFLEIKEDALVRLEHTNLPRFELTITLGPCEGGTRLDWCAVFEDAVFAERLRGFLETANAQNLDRLEEVLRHAQRAPA